MVEIIPKPAAKLPPRIYILFYGSLFALFVLALSFFILDVLDKRTKEEIQKTEEILASKDTQEIKDLQKYLSEQRDKIKDLTSVINGHQKDSNFFSLIEDKTHPQVFFSGIDLDVKTKKVKIKGTTESFQILGEQIIILKEEKSLQKLTLSEIKINEERKIEFGLTFSLDPSLLK